MSKYVLNLNEIQKVQILAFIYLFLATSFTLSILIKTHGKKDSSQTKVFFQNKFLDITSGYLFGADL